MYVRDDAGVLQFHALPTPTPEQVADVARWTYEGLARVCERHGRSFDELDADADTDELAHDQPALAACYGASVSDRRRLERLCRYVARPPVAQDRLELSPDRQRLVYRFKHAWRDGTHAVLLDPLDLIARLVALIPPPRFHMVRYHGVLAAHANARSEVVPGRVPAPAKPTQLRLFAGEATELELGCASPGSTKPSNRHPWAWLLQRVFAVDVMTCPRCRGAMKLVVEG